MISRKIQNIQISKTRKTIQDVKGEFNKYRKSQKYPNGNSRNKKKIP
jgi:hypothetical protein